MDSPEAACRLCWLLAHALVLLKSTIISFVLLTLTERPLSLLGLSAVSLYHSGVVSKSDDMIGQMCGAAAMGQQCLL